MALQGTSTATNSPESQSERSLGSPFRSMLWDVIMQDLQ